MTQPGQGLDGRFPLLKNINEPDGALQQSSSLAVTETNIEKT